MPDRTGPLKVEMAKPPIRPYSEKPDRIRSHDNTELKDERTAPQRARRLWEPPQTGR